MQDDVFFDYAKTHYFAEFERKKDLAAGITTSTGIASIVGAGIYALAFKLPAISTSFGAACYAGLMMAAIIFTVAIYRLVRAHVGHEYKHTAAITGIIESRRQAATLGYDEQQLSTATKLLLEDQYAESVGFNEPMTLSLGGFFLRSAPSP